jgi:hypothetical protein
MHPFIRTSAAVILLLNCVQLVPAGREFSPQIAGVSALLAAGMLAASFAGKRSSPAAKPAAAEALMPAAAKITADGTKHAEAVTLLGIFQEKGRLVDFLMDDIAPYTDAQVGSVVRAVHQGCKAALQEHFTIQPVASEPEGALITIPAGYPADEFRLVGNLSGQAPFHGKLVHKGWKVASAKLPRTLKADENRLPTIAAAEVEIS